MAQKKSNSASTQTPASFSKLKRDPPAKFTVDNNKPSCVIQTTTYNVANVRLLGYSSISVRHTINTEVLRLHPTLSSENNSYFYLFHNLFFFCCYCWSVCLFYFTEQFTIFLRLRGNV